MKQVKTNSRPWAHDIDLHPLSPLKPKYGPRCQNKTDAVCPYCERSFCMLCEESGDYTCEQCEMPFHVHVHFGYGYSSGPLECKRGHIFVFSTEYPYEGKNVRLHRCLCCDEMIYDKTSRSLLPWHEKYDDPDFFDPDGVLDTGRSIEEQVLDRMHGPGTPILDALFNNDVWPNSSRIDNALILSGKPEADNFCGVELEPITPWP